jgi:mannose-6-phosphate isomerase-like protein (cupin superfamily)
MEIAQYGDLFGGRGAVRVADLLSGDEVVAPFAAVLDCTLEAGGSVGRHVQTDFAEIVVFLEGRGAATVGAVRRDVGPGSVVSVPLGEPLGIESAAGAALRYVIVKAAPPPL